MMFLTPIVNAHPGRTDSNGGHYCWTNCSKWGLSYGEYHYHNSAKNYNPPKVDYTPLVEPIDIYINGAWQYYDPSAYIKNGTTLVPMRAIFEELGATVNYDSKNKKITAIKDGKKIVFSIGNKKAYVNDKGVTSSISLGYPAEIKNGSTMVPIRFISEALGARVNWDGLTNTIEINN
ncbi:copper amine oxidase N-terminal domain-containing protein [Ornithinibacillus scapharcae]|uniref:copper amine oxidase N-terminal domain-containing protein n=1 Tax=Ornithinibacillus scapharcae TaxID=1147159 RepID=UPI003B4372D9